MKGRRLKTGPNNKGVSKSDLPNPSPTGLTDSAVSTSQHHGKRYGRQGTNKIFICYRRQDSSDVTGRIYDRLVNHFGRERVFKDVDSVPLGVDYRKYLDDVVGKCEVLIAVIGDQWLETVGTGGKYRLNDQGDFVRIEIESALKRGIPVIPILVRDAAIPKEDDLPLSLRELAYRNGLPIRTDPDFHKDVDRLITGLEAHLGTETA